ncbi:MAG: hypothetical protein Q8L37_04320 [Candidatus Gottesmanbacteria bacterium]|nr:hypothetical protein [Candidatus Gottesmanbacteria bacterium]
MESVFAQKLTIPGNNAEKEFKELVEGPLGSDITNIGSIITKAIPFIFSFAGLALLLMLIMAGFDLLTSAGDAKKLESGKQRLTYAILGILLIIVAYWIVQLAGKIFGVVEIQSVFK